MSNETLLRILLVLAGVFLGIILTIVISSVGESPDQAYERGKIDGQLLVFEKWGDYDKETIDVFIDCIHLLNLSKFGLLSIDSTDTMLRQSGTQKPAVERDSWKQKDVIDDTKTLLKEAKEE